MKGHIIAFLSGAVIGVLLIFIVFGMYKLVTTVKDTPKEHTTTILLEWKDGKYQRRNENE
jgi:hypothetical protein